MNSIKSNPKIQWLCSLLLVSFAASALSIGATYLKAFQLFEWLTFDTWVRLRPLEAKDERIVVVTISESDISELGQWPISDRTLSQLITRINQQQPRAIGLDIYRDLPIKPGTEELETVLRSTPNLIGVEKAVGQKVKTSPILEEQEQTALADVVKDTDGKIRRGLLSIELNDGQVELGLATILALMYLELEGIQPELEEDTGIISIGQTELVPFKSNHGGYVGADEGGIQILMNYRGKQNSFSQISIIDVLNDRVAEDLFRDRIVLIGAVAVSLNDFLATPYSINRANQVEDLPGVFIHANLTSQIVSGALDGRSSINSISEFGEWIWIFAWSFGVSTSNLILLNRQSNLRQALLIFGSTVLSLVIPGLLLMGSGYLLFLKGFWLPVISPLFSLTLSTITISWYYNQNQTKLASIDSLTQIPNRRSFEEFLEQKWGENRKKKQNLSLVLCDVDFFKKYNDTYGHQAGDSCLQKVAKVLAKSVRNSDLAARYGGEEFVVVLPNTPPEIAIVVAQRICDRLKSLEIPHLNSEAGDYVTMSCGVANSNFEGVNSSEELIAKADKALYQAKAQGRDRAVLGK
ncbi:MAG: diguanylate cyclase [Xenococcaceae cyanobacterium MO_167.B52]|nr:diguanylate cyclase [Xenococcaceae cyanobacterium MO_167.B52]